MRILILLMISAAAQFALADKPLKGFPKFATGEAGEMVTFAEHLDHGFRYALDVAIRCKGEDGKFIQERERPVWLMARVGACAFGSYSWDNSTQDLTITFKTPEPTRAGKCVIDNVRRFNLKEECDRLK